MKETTQLNLDLISSFYKKEDALKNIQALIKMYKEGKLGGEVMPEDARPDEIDISSADNFHFLTLPMALNYQRNSYKLWEAAAKTYLDIETRDVFIPNLVNKMPVELLREKLMKYKLALQPLKHIDTWRRISSALAELFNGDVRNMFNECNNDVIKLRSIIQESEKKRFPYLSGPKIFNYWLHVMEIYTTVKLSNRNEITVAPDTHIIQGTLRLGLLNESIEELSQNRIKVSDEWKRLLSTTNIAPIDTHTPLWLWSRRGFPDIILSDNISGRD
jgi:hypothetical protein